MAFPRIKKKEGMPLKRDVTTKLLEEYPDVFADIGNVNLYGGKPVISPDDLELLPSNLSYQDMAGTHRELRPDIRMRVRTSGIDISIICVENQTGICNTMPVRDMGYEYASYEAQIREIKAKNKKDGKNYYTREIGNDQKLTPVIPLILYFGKEPWTTPLSLLDLLAIPENQKQWVEPLIQNHYIRLIHLRTQNAETRSMYRSDFRYVVDFLAYQNNMNDYLRFMKNDTGTIQHPEALLDVMNALTGDNRYQRVKETLKEHIDKKERITMVSFAEELENRGIERGMERGIEKGIEKGMDTINHLIERLMEDGRTDDLLRSAKNPDYQRSLLREYGIKTSQKP